MNNASHKFSTPLSCAIFPSCSGCSKMGDTTQIEEKAILESWAKEKNIPCKFKAHSPYGYRIRTKLPCRLVENRIELGLFKRATHNLVPMPFCPLHTKSINSMIAPLKVLLEDFKIIPFSENTQKGEKRAIQMTDNRKGGLQIAMSFLERKRDLSPFFKEVLNLKKDLSLWINDHKDPTSNALFSSNWTHMGGEEEFWIPFGEREFCFHPGSFIQSNPNLFEVLLSDLKEKIPSGSKILELFAGVGVIGSQFAHLANKITLVESNPLCKEMFHLFQKRYDLKNLLFRTQVAEEFSEFESYDVLILDPPRKGLAKQLKERLATSSVSKILYISCCLPSLQRDVEDLKACYKLVDLKGYLLFPGTDQVETVAELKRVK